MLASRRQIVELPVESIIQLKLLSIFLDVPYLDLFDDIIKETGGIFLQKKIIFDKKEFEKKEIKKVFLNIDEDTTAWLKQAKEMTKIKKYKYLYYLILENYLSLYLDAKGIRNEYKDFVKNITMILKKPLK